MAEQQLEDVTASRGGQYACSFLVFRFLFARAETIVPRRRCSMATARLSRQRNPGMIGDWLLTREASKTSVAFVRETVKYKNVVEDISGLCFEEARFRS